MLIYSHTTIRLIVEFNQGKTNSQYQFLNLNKNFDLFKNFNLTTKCKFKEPDSFPN